MLQEFHKSESGATTIEYGLIAVLVTLGSTLDASYASVDSQMSAAINPPPAV